MCGINHNLRPAIVNKEYSVIHNYENNYLIENYITKPYEIDSADTSKDADESLSHAEALEMASYNRDASSIMISDCNRKSVMAQIRKSFEAFEITDEEMAFYMKNCRLNEINLFLLNTFYSGRFKDSYATLAVNRVDTIYLLLGMKKYLEYHRMPLLAQIITANIAGKYKVNLVKNSKFLDRIRASNIYQRIIADKFEYVNELDPKENPIIKYLSIIINCEFELVDENDELNGQMIRDITSDEMASEFLLFLSII